MKILLVMCIIAFSNSSSAETLMLFATPIKSEKLAISPSELDEVESSHVYELTNLNVMSGSYSGDRINFIMAQNLDQPKLMIDQPQRWYLELEKSNLSFPKYRAISWSLYTAGSNQINKEQESIAFSAEEGVE